MKKLIIITFFIMSCFANSVLYDTKDEMLKLKEIVNSVHNSFKYGVGTMKAEFNDEIVKYGEGHCGHYSWMLLREFIKKGYEGEIVSIITYNHRNHAMVEIERKSDKKKILVDATTNLVYSYGVEDILKKPSLSQDRIGQSTSPSYSDIDFWNSVKILRYYPYIGYLTVNNIKSITTKEAKVFYPKPNGIESAFDNKYNTYTATKMNQADNIVFSVDFKKENRLSSIVIEPYSNGIYPSKIKLYCNNKIIVNKTIKPKRGMLIINLVEPEQQYCKKLKFNFSDFQGQNRLLIRDIYFYGK